MLTAKNSAGDLAFLQASFHTTLSDLIENYANFKTLMLIFEIELKYQVQTLECIYGGGGILVFSVRTGLSMQVQINLDFDMVGFCSDELASRIKS